jgi:hypothetical protein
MKNFLLFKTYKTPMLIPFLYWVGFVAFFFAAYQFYELNTYYLNDDGYQSDHHHYERYQSEKKYLQMESQGYNDELNSRYDRGYINKEEYEAGIAKIEKRLEEEKEGIKMELESFEELERNYIETKKNEISLIAIIALIIIQLLWRVCCEWWERWFSFLNIKRDNSEDNITENKTSKLIDIVMLKAKFTIPFYIIFYALGLLGMLGALVLIFMEAPAYLGLLEYTGIFVFFIFAQIFWRLIFEFYIVLFKFLTR